jgi:hypothetical protein
MSFSQQPASLSVSAAQVPAHKSYTAVYAIIIILALVLLGYWVWKGVKQVRDDKILLLRDYVKSRLREKCPSLSSADRESKSDEIAKHVDPTIQSLLGAVVCGTSPQSPPSTSYSR